MDASKLNSPASGLDSLERKVRFGFVVAAILLLLIGLLSYYSVVRFRADARQVEHTHQVLNSLNGLLSSLSAAESGQRGFLITGKDEHRQQFDDASQLVQQQLHRLRELTQDNSFQQTNLDALEPLVANRLSLMRSRMAKARQDGLPAAQAAMLSDEGRLLRESIGKIVGNMEDQENRLLQQREARAALSSLVTQVAIAAGGIVALTLLLAAFFLVGQGFARSRLAESELLRARDTLETRVSERTFEVVKNVAAVRAGEERLSRIIDSAMDAIITVDHQQRITLFNPAAEKMFRCPVSDAIGAPLDRFLPARFRAAHSDHVRGFGLNSVTRRTMGGFTPLFGLRANGEEFPIEASISQVEIDGKKLFTAIVRDVADASKSRETSARLASIVESTDDAIVSKTLDGIITSWNPAAEKLFGYSASEAIGKPMRILFPPELANEDPAILASIAKGQSIDHFETQRVRKDGKRIDVSVTISPLRDNSGKIIGASQIARDITERKRAQEEIRQQVGLLNLAPALVRDMDDRIVAWTLGAARHFGFSQEEAIGRVCHDLLQTQFPVPLPEIEKTLNTKGVWEGELIHCTRDGQRVVSASQWVLHRDARNAPIRILEVNADITALRRAELLQMRSQKLEALGTLAGGIAHDFNNILAAISGSASLAITEIPKDHPLQTLLLEIEKAGARGADLVRRILKFSRPQDQNLEPQAFEPVVEEAVKLVRATIPTMIEIRSEFAPNLPKVRLDATQMYQVIVNLITNAAHAIGDKPGLIEVKLDARTISDEEIKLYSDVQAGHYVRLMVNDNGCGMDSATLQRIFDPFFSTKATGKGTGLGLSVVHGIVTSHQGVIRVYSEPAKGTTFYVYFPAVRGSIDEAPAHEGQIPTGRGERILFVDDEGVLLFVGTMNLEQNGYKVTGVSNGESALQELQQNPAAFDVLITDLSMPGMSGLQLAQEARKLRADLPIVLTSGYINPEDQVKADQLGIRSILTKPVNNRELLSCLATLFSAPRVNSKSAS